MTKLTDDQVREITSRWGSGPSLGAVDNLARRDVAALLADREALVADFQAELTRRMALHLKQADEITELKTRMAEGFAARKGQIENGAKMIAGLQAENAKLRKVLSDAKPILEGFAAKNPKRPILCNGDVVMQDPAGVFSLLSFIDILEPPNVPDATDDKR